MSKSENVIDLTIFLFLVLGGVYLCSGMFEEQPPPVNNYAVLVHDGAKIIFEAEIEAASGPFVSFGDERIRVSWKRVDSDNRMEEKIFPRGCEVKVRSVEPVKGKRTHTG